MIRKTGRGPKAKGRSYENEVVAETLAALPHLSQADVTARAMGDLGIDLLLSQRAREVIPFAIECKRTERLNLYESIAQAEANAAKEHLAPAVIFRRNRSPSYVIMRLETLLDLLAERATDRGYLDVN